MCGLRTQALIFGIREDLHERTVSQEISPPT